MMALCNGNILLFVCSFVRLSPETDGAVGAYRVVTFLLYSIPLAQVL